MTPKPRSGTRAHGGRTTKRANRAAGPRGALVRLRIGSGLAGVAATIDHEHLIAKAAHWMYVLRNRSRWKDDEDQRLKVQEKAEADLAVLGVRKAALKKIGGAQHVEVEIAISSGEHFSPLELAATSFPWEFVLSAATSSAGRSDPLLVTRLIPQPGKAPKGKPSSFLFLENSPGVLDGYYSFDQEYARLRAATGWQHWRWVKSEPPERIASRVASAHVLHVSGVDNHQAVQIDDFPTRDGKKPEDDTTPIPDGMIVCGNHTPARQASSLEVAKALVPPGSRPWLITFNLYYSSSRTCVECLRRGAFAAIGFQDEISDDMAELFFQKFYRAWWTESDAIDLPAAFRDAWNAVRAESPTPGATGRSRDLYGTGIVLWLAQSAFVGRKTTVQRRTDFEPKTALRATEDQEKEAKEKPIGDVLQVEVKVPPAINYSLLHNGRPFLERLTLHRLVDHPLEEVSVTVDINVGDGSQPYRHTETLLDKSQLSLAEGVRLPLTAPLLRSVREGVQSTVYTKVMWANRIAHESTKPVMLLPVDEWLDDTEQNPWLPSFVLPRDPVVADIIATARRHLVTLLDDVTAGFDGYQSVDPDLEDPEQFIDLQVRAIWAALVHEYRLQYINPPPAYFERSQRLRMPSEVIGTKSGTCVDLALLLASCLEYIDLYPVVVLLSGHAFVGYWRNPDDHDEFARVEHVPASVPIDIGQMTRGSDISLVDEFGWRLAKQQYPEIMQYLRRGKLKFLEATGLCFNFSFAEALKKGAANLKDETEFDSLLDIGLARSAKPEVTPLPILAEFRSGRS